MQKVRKTLLILANVKFVMALILDYFQYSYMHDMLCNMSRTITLSQILLFRVKLRGWNLALILSSQISS